jgi:hypothetical protein
MKMIDIESNKRVNVLQLYLTPQEARYFRSELDQLLVDPEATDHSHIDLGTGSELSVSILTERKLKNKKAYSKIEQEILKDDEQEPV